MQQRNIGNAIIIIFNINIFWLSDSVTYVFSREIRYVSPFTVHLCKYFRAFSELNLQKKWFFLELQTDVANAQASSFGFLSVLKTSWCPDTEQVLAHSPTIMLRISRALWVPTSIDGTLVQISTLTLYHACTTELLQITGSPDVLVLAMREKQKDCQFLPSELKKNIYHNFKNSLIFWQ